MKQLLLLITIFLFTLSSTIFASENALDKGAVRIGGSISFQRFTGDAYSDVTIFNFTPSASYAVNNGFFIGINTQIEKYRSNTNWSIGPIVEFYFPTQNSLDDLTKTVVPYMRFFATKGKSNSADFKYLGLNLGFLKMLNQHIGLDFGISYSYDKIEGKQYYSFYGSPLTERSGHRLMVGLGIESFLF